MPKKPPYSLPPLEITKQDIGKNISKVRKKRGLTQIELADEIGITQTLVSDYETGRSNLSSEMIIRFAMALNVSADILLGIKDGINEEKTPSLKITRRLREIEKLPPNKQKIILRNIDLDLAGLSS